MNSFHSFLNRARAAHVVLLTSVILCSLAQAADEDNDGVPDALDKCSGSAAMPSVSPAFTYKYAISRDRLMPGSKSWPVDEHGCEVDSDGDGVSDSKDYCPEDSPQAHSAGVAKNGCPKQSDFDGTPDYRDKCPGTPRGVATDRYGCAK